MSMDLRLARALSGAEEDALLRQAAKAWLDIPLPIREEIIKRFQQTDGERWAFGEALKQIQYHFEGSPFANE